MYSYKKNTELYIKERPIWWRLELVVTFCLKNCVPDPSLDMYGTIFIETGLQIWSCVWAGTVMCAGERERVVRNY